MKKKREERNMRVKMCEEGKKVKKSVESVEVASLKEELKKELLG